MGSAEISRKLAVIVHADVAGSTDLVQRNETLAHNRIKDAFQRFSSIIQDYGGTVHEIRGDALVAEFSRASDAVCSVVVFQQSNTRHNEQIGDDIVPVVRVGIALGEVVFSDDTVTGAGVVLAQRVEQLAEPGGVCITGAIHEAIPERMPFFQKSLGEQKVKGFKDSVRVYYVELRSGESIPLPEVSGAPESSLRVWRMVAAVVAFALVIVGGVAFWFKPWESRIEPASLERMVFPLPDKPSIAILPFDNMSTDPRHAYLSDGISENIITELSRFRELFVIARQSSFNYKGKPVTFSQVSEELGVQYVAQGSVQATGDRVRVTAQLIDAMTGNHVWAERYDRTLTDVFTIQDEIVRKIVSMVSEEVQVAESERALRKHPRNLRMFEYILRGRELLRRFTKPATEEARQMYEMAREADPNYAEAYEGLAKVYNFAYRWGLLDSVSRQSAVQLGCDMARKAVALEPFWYRGHWSLANCYMFSGALDESLAEYERALELNPNSSEVSAAIAEPLVYLGRAADAIARLQSAIRLNPYHPDWFLWQLAWAQYMTGEYEYALATIKRMNRMPNEARRTLAPVLVRLGRLEEARTVVKILLENNPDNYLEDMKVFPFRHEEYLERWIEDLRKAGLPESPTPPLPDKPSIAVLPFDNFSGDETFDYMSDGISENIITALARSPWLLVMSRTSSFVYKNRSATAQQVGSELGVRYVLEGSVQKGSDKVRITAQLIDAGTGDHLWAEKFDQAGNDPLAIQDVVAGKINQTLGSLNGILLGQIARQRAWVKQSVNLEEYDFVLRGHDHFLRWTQDEMAKAREAFEQGLERFPDSALLKSKVAWARYTEVLQGWSPDPEADFQTAIELAEGVLTDVRTSLLAEFLARWVLAFLYASSDVTRAMNEMEKAVALVPGDGMARADLAGFQFWTGAIEDGWKNLAIAERVDPAYAWIPYYKALGHRLEGDCQKAMDAMQAFYESPLKYLFVAACSARLNETEESNIALRKAQELWPGVTVSLHRDSLGFRDQVVVQEYLNDLRKAGLPE